MVGGTVVNTYGLGWVHFEKLPLSTFWWVIIARSCSSILSLIAIRIFCPNVFSRFGLGNKPKQLLISLGVVLLLMGPSLLQIDYRGVGSAQIFESFVFALFIGIDEDLFSRGFAFGVIERYGVWIAAILSSLQFGLLHRDWVSVIGDLAIYSAVGWVLIVLSDPSKKERLMHLARKFGLLDETPTATSLN